MTRRLPHLAAVVTGAVLALAAGTALTQIPAARPVNSFTTSDEARLGREAAAAVRGRLQVVGDADVVRFVSAMGRRLAAAVPRHLRQPSFAYGFSVLNVRDVTTVVLPGGQVFVSAPLVALLPGDDALAAVLAHDLAHVVLRHATLQVTASGQFEIGGISGRQIGIAAAAPLPGILERGSTFSIASFFLSFGAAYEREAEDLGLRIMEAAGFDPAGFTDFVAAMRLEGAAHGGLEWLGGHPGTRLGRDGDTPMRSARFKMVQASLRRLPRPSRSIGNMTAFAAPVGTLGFHVPRPEGVYRRVTAGDRLQLQVPEGWRRVLSGNTVMFIPEGASILLLDGPAAITHGFEVGVARGTPGSLEADTIRLLSALGRHDPTLIWTPAFRTSRIAGRNARSTTLSHVCGVTGGFETVMLTTMHLDDGSLLYFLGVAPQADAGTYRGVFEQIVASLQVLD